MRAKIATHVTCHVGRDAFATYLLENGNNLRGVQKLMGHADVKTTEIYTHLRQSDMGASQSPVHIFQGLLWFGNNGDMLSIVD